MRAQTSEIRSRKSAKLLPRRGFTLIELIVVIGIILLLMGLILGVATALNAQTESRATQNTLKLLDLALHEWETTADRSFTWGKDNEPPGTKYDVQRTYGNPNIGDAEVQTSVVLSRLKNTPGCKEILARIDQDMFVSDNSDPNLPRLKLLDAWNKEIVIVHPGRLPNPILDGPNPLRDADGTIRVTPAWSPDINENRVGICVNRRICFISAGPDGKFGHLEDPPNSTTYQQAADNIYSYPLEKP